MTKNKIGIVTLHGYDNYGNRLQNYALKYTLEKLNFDVYTTIISRDRISIKEKVSNFIKLFNRPLEQNLMKLKKGIRNKISSKKYLYENSASIRKEKFKSFSNSYLNEIFYKLGEENTKESLNEYSYFVTGSDQVWNPYTKTLLPIYFLSFTEKNKRIAYAPSISHDILPQEYKTVFKENLSNMAQLSIREESGARIVKELINKQIPVLVDPTMLLKKEEWLAIANKASNRPDKPYILTYFLGGPDQKTKEKIDRIAQDNNMEVLNLGVPDEKETFETGPAEFIDYINKASVLFTDSFHGVVFSIVLETPFVVFERNYIGPSMYSRVDTLLKKFNYKYRESKAFEDDLFTDNLFSMDFSNSKNILKKEYNKSLNYLKESLK